MADDSQMVMAGLRAKWKSPAAPHASHWQFKCGKFFSNLMSCLGAGDAGDLPAVAAILPEDTNEPASAAF
jgi:hypothetical protein